MFAWAPVVSRWANLVFFVQTFTRWHAGIAHDHNVAEWMARFGALTPSELAASERLREVLQRGDGESEGATLLQAVLPHEDGEGAARAAAGWSPADEATWNEAVDAFTPRFERSWPEAERRLRTHADALAGSGPAWFREAAEATDRFFGARTGGQRVRVYLLMSAEGWSGGNGPMLTGPGGMTFECSGVGPQRFERLLPGFLHELMHSVHQPAVLRDLFARLLTEPDIAAAEPGAYRATAIGRTGLGFEDYLGEVVLHSLWPDGALARRFQPDPGRNGLWKRFAATASTYDWWVFFVAEVLAGMSRTYVDEGWPIDLDFVRHAYDIHLTLRRHAAA